MELELHRLDSTPSRTIGKLSIAGVFHCWTLEDVVRTGPKVPGSTAIPAGSYRVIMDYSNRFKRDMLHVLGVRGFTGIRFHAGNTAADTEGCILVGKQRGLDSVYLSRAAIVELEARVRTALSGHDEVWLTIPPT